MKNAQMVSSNLNDSTTSQGFSYDWEQVSCPSPSSEDEFDVCTAWWLAQCSQLAYANKIKTATELKKAGFDRITFFDANGTQAFLAQHPGKGQRFAILAFRGTEQDSIDILTDINFFRGLFPNESNPSEKMDKPYYAHAGFLEGIHSVWGTALHPRIHELYPDKGSSKTVEWRGFPGISDAIFDLQGIPLYCTGHSLGGALATLAAYKAVAYGEAINLKAVYTFGAPRAAQNTLAAAIEKDLKHRLYRIVNDKDVVPRLPPFVPFLLDFHHAGTLIHFHHQSGGISIDKQAAQNFCDDVAVLLQMGIEFCACVLSFKRYTPATIVRHQIREYLEDIQHELDSQRASDAQSASDIQPKRELASNMPR